MSEVQNSAPEVERRGGFPKGQSGNPGGRPKAIKAVEDLARQHTPAAIAALVEALSDPKAKVAAATALLNRAWGMPRQAIVGEDADGAPLPAIVVTFVRPE